MATHSSVLAWRISWTEEPGWLQPWCRKESDATEGLFTFPVQGPLWGSPKCTPCLPSPPVPLHSLSLFRHLPLSPSNMPLCFIPLTLPWKSHYLILLVLSILIKPMNIFSSHPDSSVRLITPWNSSFEFLPQQSPDFFLSYLAVFFLIFFFFNISSFSS